MAKFREIGGFGDLLGSKPEDGIEKPAVEEVEEKLNPESTGSSGVKKTAHKSGFKPKPSVLVPESVKNSEEKKGEEGAGKKDIELFNAHHQGFFIIIKDRKGSNEAENKKFESYEVVPGITGSEPELYGIYYDSVDPDWTIERQERVSVAYWQSHDYESSDGMGTRTAGGDKSAGTRLAKVCWSRAAGRNFAVWIESMPKLRDWCTMVHKPRTADGIVVEDNLPERVNVRRKFKLKTKYLGDITTSQAENALLDEAIKLGIDLD